MTHPDPQAGNPAGAAPRRAPSAALARLRAATVGLHAQVDGLFAQGIDSPLTYRRYLLGMHRFAIDCEIATDAPPRASAWLAADLVALAMPPLVALGMRRPLADRAERLGWEYVMAGSSLGARVLSREVAQLGYDASHGARFLARHAGSDDWAVIQSKLSTLDAGDARRIALAEAGARDAFAHVQACFTQSFDLIPEVSP